MRLIFIAGFGNKTQPITVQKLTDTNGFAKMTIPALKDFGPKAPPFKLLKKALKLQKAGKFAESKLVCESLESKGYESPELLHVHGLALRACGDLNGATIKINAALEYMPDNYSILNSLGSVFHQMKEYELAVELFKRSTTANDKFYDGWKNLGIALRSLERYQAAEVALNCAYHLDRTQVEPLLQLVYILCDIGYYKRAEEVMDNLIFKGPYEITPSIRVRRMHVASRNNDMDYIEKTYPTFDKNEMSVDDQVQLDNLWAYYLGLNNRREEEIAVLEKCLEKDSIHKEQILSHLAICYADSGQLDEVIAIHETMLENNPEHLAVRYNLSNLQFKKGTLKEAYENYESRWLWRDFPTKRRLFDAPLWKGEPLEGKKILIWREQGLGDEVSFSGIMQDLEHMGAEVIFECLPKLAPLWKNSFPWLTIRREGPQNCHGEEGYMDLDYHIPMGTLGGIFRHSVEDYYAKQKPWIKRSPVAENIIRSDISVAKDEVLVGICWRSSNMNAFRSPCMLNFKQLEPLKNLKNVKWLNVQYDATAEEIESMREFGMQVHNYTDVNQKDDLVSACNLMGACDIVISVGVSVADFAGGLGVPLIGIYDEKSKVFMNTDHLPAMPTCKAVAMKHFTGDEVISDIVENWPSYLEWAAELNAGRGQSDIAVSTSNQLDREYHTLSQE